MAEYKNILIAFDGSPQSAKALKTAESLAKHYDAQLTVAFVYDDSKERSVGYGTAVAPNTGATTVEPGIGPGSVTTPAFSNPDSIESEEPDRVIASAKNKLSHDVDAHFEILRSEERRVGKECRCWGWREHSRGRERNQRAK